MASIRLDWGTSAVIEYAHTHDGRIDVTPKTPYRLLAAGRLWVEGMLEIVGHDTVAQTMAFRLTKDGEEMARVVCAA